jgi:hypothetical protein
MKVEHSVPKGSVLGPPYKLSHVQGVKLVLFADDMNLLITGKDKFVLQHKPINVMSYKHGFKKTIL